MVRCFSNRYSGTLGLKIEVWSSLMCKLLKWWNIIQQSARCIGSWRKGKYTSYYIVSAAAHLYLGICLGHYGHWPSFNCLGFFVYERFLEPLSLLLALWLCLDSASTFPQFRLKCLGFAMVPFPCLVHELGSAWSTPPWSWSRSEIGASSWVGDVISVAGCTWRSYTLLIGGAEEASYKSSYSQVICLCGDLVRVVGFTYFSMSKDKFSLMSVNKLIYLY